MAGVARAAMQVKSGFEGQMSTGIEMAELMENREALMREHEEFMQELDSEISEKTSEMDEGEDLDKEQEEQQQQFYNQKQQDELRKQLAEEQKKALVEAKMQRVRNLRKDLKINDTAAAIIAVITIIITFVENEDYYDKRSGKDRNEQSTQGIILRSLNTFLTFALIFLVIRRNVFSYEVHREKMISGEAVGPNFFKSYYVVYMIIEVCICIIHCPPWMNIE